MPNWSLLIGLLLWCRSCLLLSLLRLANGHLFLFLFVWLFSALFFTAFHTFIVKCFYLLLWHHLWLHHLTIKPIYLHCWGDNTHLHITPLGMLRHLAVWLGRSGDSRYTWGNTDWCPSLHLRLQVVHHGHLIYHRHLIHHRIEASVHILVPEELINRHIGSLLKHSWLLVCTKIHHVWRELWLTWIVGLGKVRWLPHHSIWCLHKIFGL